MRYKLAHKRLTRLILTHTQHKQKIDNRQREKKSRDRNKLDIRYSKHRPKTTNNIKGRSRRQTRYRKQTDKDTTKREMEVNQNVKVE